MKPISNLNRGFTLIELLTVIAIIAILAALLFPAIKGSMSQAEKSKAQAGISSLATAFRSYYTEYGKWPIIYTANPQYEDFIVDDQIVALLAGDDVGGASTKYPAPTLYHPRVDTAFNPPYNTMSANAIVQGNPRKIVFLEFKTKDLDGSGHFVDPWGKPYHFRLDVNYQNQVDYPFAAAGSPIAGVGFLIWSPGPDGQYNHNDIVKNPPPPPYLPPVPLQSQDSQNKDNIKSW
jgi:prepilin-type N-terminal cleavage/methylation domain-containing protein